MVGFELGSLTSSDGNEPIFPCFFSSGIAVGQVSILSAEEIAKEALDAKADVIVVENEDLLKRVLLIQHKLPELRAIVQIKGEPPVTDKRRLNRTHKVRLVHHS